MPTYEYRCAACDHEFEQFQSITADALTKCPECGKRKLQRLIGTGGAILFKGSGFYETDYRSDSYKKAADAETKAKSDKPESKDKTTKPIEKKPAKKKESKGGDQAA